MIIATSSNCLRKREIERDKDGKRVGEINIDRPLKAGSNKSPVSIADRISKQNCHIEKRHAISFKMNHKHNPR